MRHKSREIAVLSDEAFKSLVQLKLKLSKEGYLLLSDRIDILIASYPELLMTERQKKQKESVLNGS